MFQSVAPAPAVMVMSNVSTAVVVLVAVTLRMPARAGWVVTLGCAPRVLSSSFSPLKLVVAHALDLVSQRPDFGADRAALI